MRWPALSAIAASIVVILGLLVTNNGHLFMPAEERAMAGLVEAVGKRRLFEPRLAGGFRYGPFVDVARGPTQPSDWGILAAAARIRARQEKDPTPANTRALAAAHVLVGEASVAVELLRPLAAAQPADPLVWNDLAAAYLVRAQREGRAEDYVASLEAASHALELRPDFPEALFNRALSLRSLRLYDQARDACERLLAIDTSEWREATRALLTELPAGRSTGSRRLDGREPDESRSEVSRGRIESSVEWARLEFERRLKAVATTADIERLAEFGAEFRAVTGDASIERVATELRAAPDTRSVYAAYARAREDYVAGRFTVARATFARVLPDLAGRVSALAPWTRLFLAIIDYQEGGVRVASAAFERLLRESTDQPLLEARIQWMLGLCAISGGQWDDAATAFRSAKRVFEAAHDRGNSGYMSEQLADVLNFLGRHDLSWAHRLAALEAIDDMPDVYRRTTLLLTSGARATDSGAPRAALAFLEEGQRLFVRDGLGRQPELALEEARAKLALRRPDAESMLLQQEPAIRSIDDRIRRERLLGEYFRVASGFVGTEPKERVRAALNDGIKWLGARNDRARLAPLLVQRGRLERREGDYGSARRDLEESIRLLCGESEADEELKLSRLHLVGEALEVLVDVRLNQGATAKQVMAMADNRWTLAATGIVGRLSATDLDRVISRIRPDAAVLGFLPLERETLSWCVTVDGIAFERLPLGRTALEALTSAQDQAPKEDTDSPDRDVVARLLAPHESCLRGRDRGFIAASGPLTRVLWGASKWRRQRPLALALAIVPSLEFILQHEGEVVRPPGTVLAVASPGSRGLPFLERVRAEASLVVGALGSGQVLSGPELRKSAVLSVLTNVTAFHFAGHAIGNAEHPSWSRLVLSGGDNGSEDLLAREIWQHDLRNLEVVTLSACSAGVNQNTLGEGSLSLATAFLKAGAKQVVAPLGEISDREAPAVMEELYRRLAQEDATQALAEVQREGSRADRVASKLMAFSAVGLLRPANGI
jgi:tetratricopeptide (TPR) repeat protein